MSSLLDRIQELTGRFLGDRRAGAASAGGAVFLGFLFLVWTGLGGGLCNLSYDFPFVIRAMLPGLQPAAPTNEAVVVYMDDKSHRELPQPWLQPWDRRIHADLVEVLRTAHAKAVVFDLLFDQPATNDAVLARAAVAHGAVFLGAKFETQMQGKVAGLTLVPPVQRLREVAAWGPVEAAAMRERNPCRARS